MNLVKNGTVLLAALSVFALTSCNKTQSLTYEKACEWVENHYDETAEKTYDSITTTWDFRKTDGEKNLAFVKKMMLQLGFVPAEVLEEKGVNGSYIDKEESGTSESCDVEEFKKIVNGDDKKEAKKTFSVTNNILSATVNGKQTIRGMTGNVVAIYKFDNKCHRYYEKYKFNNTEINIPDGKFTINGNFVWYINFTK